jgi:hypothetical protein
MYILQTIILDINFKNGETEIEVLCNRLTKSINELDAKNTVVNMTAVEKELIKEGDVETGMAKS